MRIRSGKKTAKRWGYVFSEGMPAVIYPRMYCPRCGSLNIGLKQIADSETIWSCWECAADFRLEFPSNRRF